MKQVKAKFPALFPFFIPTATIRVKACHDTCSMMVQEPLLAFKSFSWAAPKKHSASFLTERTHTVYEYVLVIEAVFNSVQFILFICLFIFLCWSLFFSVVVVVIF